MFARASLLAVVVLVGAASAVPAAPEKPSADLDVPMLLRGPMPAVEVMVNGKGPFIFAIDTGAQGQARVDTSLVETLGLKPTGEIQASDGSGANLRSLPTVTLDTIAVGDLVFRDVMALSRDYNRSPRLPKIDGILGFNLFEGSLLTLDFPRKRVRVARGALPEADGTRILTYDASRGAPSIPLRVGAETITAHIDSGNTIGAFVLPTSLVERMTVVGEPTVVGRARTVTSEIEIKEARLKESIRLGGYEFDEPTVVYPAISEAANIGSRALADFVVTFDQQNHRVRLERSSSGASES